MPRSRFAPALRLGALALALTATGCASTRSRVGTGDASALPLPARFGRQSVSDVLAELSRADTLRGLDGAGKIILASPAQSGTFDLRLDADPAGRFYAVVSAFGIDGGRALVRPDSVFVYNRLENTLLLGRTEDAGASLPIPLTSRDGFRTLTGTLRPDPAAGFTVETDRGEGLYRLRSSDGRRVFTVDPRRWRTLRAVRYDAAGVLAEEVLMDRYDDADRPALPGRISVRRPADSFAATLLFDHLRPVAVPGVPARLNAPSGARRRSL